MADITQSAQPGNQKNSKPSGSENLGVRDPDMVQEKIMDIWGWIEKNIVLVLALIGLVVVAVAAKATANWWSDRKEHKAQAAYYEVEAKYSKLKEGFDRAKFKALMPQLAQQDPKTQDKPATGDLTKDYGTLVSDLEKVARDHAGTSAGAQAAILAADTYMTYQQPEKAAEIAQVAAKATNEKNLTGSFARLVWGTALANKGDCKEAVKVWEQLLNNKGVSYLHGDASLRSGLCFEAMNEPQKAMQMYQRTATDAGPESSTATTAKGLLRALELKNKPAAPTTKQG